MYGNVKGASPSAAGCRTEKEAPKMSGLLYKNFRLNLSSMIFSLITAAVSCLTMILVCLFAFVLPGKTPEVEQLNDLTLGFGACYFLAFWLPSMATSTLFQVDESKTCCAFAMSLPQGAKGHIEAKYYYMLILNLSIMFVTFVSDTVTTAMTGGMTSNTVIIIIVFALVLLLSAIETPFMVRFGSQRGLAIKGAVVGGVFIFAALYFLFGDITWLIENENDPLTALMEWLQSGDIVFWLSLFPFISVAAFYLSCRISVKLFRKGAESYEQ